MTDFNDVPYIGGTTFTFFPDGHAPMIRHFVPQAHVTYQILSYEDAKAVYPDLEIPAVPQDPALTSYPDTCCQYPLVILSGMDPEALQKKLYEIKASPEAQEWEHARIKSLRERLTR